MTRQTWKCGKTIRPLFADLVTFADIYTRSPQALGVYISKFCDITINSTPSGMQTQMILGNNISEMQSLDQIAIAIHFL